MPKVSIIIPVYNVEKYLAECLESVTGQMLRDIEIICVDDGSTDRSPDILKEYMQKDGRIKVLSKLNSGYGHTMNVGLNNATGEYVGFVESDDYVRPEMYEVLYKTAKKHDVDFIKADFYRFKSEGRELKLEYNDLSHGKKEYYNKVLDPSENIVLFKFIMNTWSGIYKRDFIEKYRIRHNETPGASYQDNGFYFQTFCRASRVYFLDRPLYMNRRDNPDSSIRRRDKVFAMRDEYRYIREFLEKNPDLKSRFLPIYTLKKFHNYMFTYRRIADEFKMMFLADFSGEFKRALTEGEVDESLFTQGELKKLHAIVDDPMAFHESEQHSDSGRPPAAARKNTSLGKKVRSFFSSCGTHGLKYTMGLVSERIFGKAGRKRNGCTN